MQCRLLTMTISLILVMSHARPAWGQTPATNAPLSPQAEAIKKQVEKVGLNHKLIVIMPSGDEYAGTLTKMDATEFTMAEVDLKRNIALKYDEVKKVLQGYGGKNSISGKRVHARRSLIVGVAVVGGLLGLVILAATQAK